VGLSDFLLSRLLCYYIRLLDSLSLLYTLLIETGFVGIRMRIERFITIWRVVGSQLWSSSLVVGKNLAIPPHVSKSHRLLILSILEILSDSSFLTRGPSVQRVQASGSLNGAVYWASVAQILIGTRSPSKHRVVLPTYQYNLPSRIQLSECIFVQISHLSLLRVAH
jgi:hypothetical protein